MTKISLENFGPMLKKKRGGRGIREVSREIGISTATLSRVENGKLPDLTTFPKACKWLGVNPGDVLGFKAEKIDSSNQTVNAHFRAEKNISPETANALGEMILLAQKQLQSSNNAS